MTAGYKNRLLVFGMLAALCWYPAHGTEARPGQDTETVVITDVKQSIPYQSRGRTAAEAPRRSAENIIRHWEKQHGKNVENRNTERSSGKGSERIMRHWKVNSVSGGGTLLFSDSPESVTRDGILYTDTVSGDARILFYHLNSTNEPKKVAVILENRSRFRNKVQVTRGGMSEPGNDYLRVGKATQAEYFDTRLSDTMVLMYNGQRLLQDKMARTVLQPGELVYGVYDFTTDHEVKVTVILYPAWEDPFAFLSHASVLPKDEQRLRGTFHGMNRMISSAKSYDPSRDGIVYFPIGDNEYDLYLRGIDATDGSSVVNYGNYGVLYKIRIPTRGRQKMKYYLSPLGGVYAGAMTVRQDDGRSSLLLTPRGRVYFGDETYDIPQSEELKKRGMTLLTEDTELADLGTYRGSSAVSFEYSPPGASNLPVNIILMPENRP